MERRKVIKIKGSLYLCMPVEVRKGLGVGKGDTCEIFLIPGFGAVVRKKGGPGENPIPQEAIYSGMSAAKIAYQEVSRQAAILATKTLGKMEMAFMGQAVPRVLGKLYHQLKNDLAKPVEELTRRVQVLEALEARKREAKQVDRRTGKLRPRMHRKRG